MGIMSICYWNIKIVQMEQPINVNVFDKMIHIALFAK